MKKEYIILLIVIVASALYVFGRKDNQRNYTLPDVPVLSAKETKAIDQITITGKSPVAITKQKDSWTVGEKNFPADKTVVTDMLDQLAQFRLLALASEKKDLNRYGLSPDRAIQVKALTKEKNIRQFTIGKVSSDSSNTFVMLDNVPPIYRAGGNLRSVFEKDIAGIRDRQIIKFTPSAVTEITLTAKDKSKTFSRVDDLSSKEKEQTKQNGDKEKTFPVLVWKDASGKTPAHPELLDELIGSIWDLRCESFLGTSAAKLKTSDREKPKKPAWSISIREGSKEPVILEVLTIKAPIQAASSMNPEAFLLSTYLAEQISGQVHELLGIRTKKKD